VPEERASLASLGNPNKPFFVDAKRFPADVPWPPSLRVAFEERSPRLADYVDAFVYLGPGADKDMTGSIPLTPAQQREVDRRNALKSDGQRTMRARHQGRDQWFRSHPNELPARPSR
jgi:hypothetical protein